MCLPVPLSLCSLLTLTEGEAEQVTVLYGPIADWCVSLYLVPLFHMTRTTYSLQLPLCLLDVCNLSSDDWKIHMGSHYGQYHVVVVNVTIETTAVKAVNYLCDERVCIFPVHLYLLTEHALLQICANLGRTQCFSIFFHIFPCIFFIFGNY